jgi:hypothetical protein
LEHDIAIQWIVKPPILKCSLHRLDYMILDKYPIIPSNVA